jgi:phage tail sheath protein FI
MPVAVSYPGVYIAEIPSGVHTVVGVATSIGAFVDFFPQGPMNKAVQLFSFADFERQFGGLDIRSEASYAVQQFFLNGGSTAYAIRVSSSTAANAAVAAAVVLQDAPGGNRVLQATAASAGAWGNSILLSVDYGTTNPSTLFNLTVTEVALVNGKAQVVATEVFRNLVVDATQPNDAVAVVNASSQLVALTTITKQKLPAQTGTTSGLSPDLTKLKKGDALSVALVTTSGTTTLGTTAGLADPVPATYPALAAALQAQIRALSPTLASATVSVVGSASTQVYLVVNAGTGKASDYLVLSDGGAGLAFKLGFAAATTNVSQYALGGTAVQAQALPGSPPAQQAGSDGTWDPAADSAGVAGGLIGDSAAKTGIYALLDVDLFNILCIPATVNLPDTSAGAVATAAIHLCEQRRAFYLLDPPEHDGNRDTVTGVASWLDANASLRTRNAAVYFPRVDIPDPLNGFRLRATPASGTVAGLFARIDATRGVWKAPAGTEASLAGVQKLEYKLTDPENGVLNPVAINCLRNFPVYGPVCWGARTLNGADQLADDYKYIPVRRLALYIEESLFRGSQWVVFEPNDEPLWAQIRLSVGAFMHDLFRKGAFQGQTPQDAYFVKCSKETTTQNDINLGIVNILVGFAPLKPAEFVVIQIQQMAGQIQA